jgi:hypothetical protein
VTSTSHNDAPAVYLQEKSYCCVTASFTVLTHTPPPHVYLSQCCACCTAPAVYLPPTMLRLMYCLCCAPIQEKSYFALRLPAGWWVFGLDLALVGDIDMCQYRYVCQHTHCVGLDRRQHITAKCRAVQLHTHCAGLSR